MRTPRYPVNPQRKRELRAMVNGLVQQWVGAGVICGRCGATLASYSDKCQADLGERCPGGNAIELQRQRAEDEVRRT
jgi:ribosomal protein L40E